MQMPQMAENVFIGGFIALAGVAVKSQLPAKASLDNRSGAAETFY
ncbi:hypothetical protein X754_00075 [Mesorhizobium sp. LNJC403B00]|nr:hypothetical protein X754_00075 [Mesorhizobium sp. LNJC403B00]